MFVEKSAREFLVLARVTRSIATSQGQETRRERLLDGRRKRQAGTQ
jgi:hypothetical protein